MSLLSLLVCEFLHGGYVLLQVLKSTKKGLGIIQRQTKLLQIIFHLAPGLNFLFFFFFSVFLHMISPDHGMTLQLGACKFNLLFLYHWLPFKKIIHGVKPILRLPACSETFILIPSFLPSTTLSILSSKFMCSNCSYSCVVCRSTSSQSVSSSDTSICIIL